MMANGAFFRNDVRADLGRFIVCKLVERLLPIIFHRSLEPDSPTPRLLVGLNIGAYGGLIECMKGGDYRI